MITLYDFNSMDEKGKGDTVFSQGTFIDDRAENGYKIQLYRVHGFYVEVYYHAKRNAVERYRAFNSAGQLGAYLKPK